MKHFKKLTLIVGCLTALLSIPATEAAEGVSQQKIGVGVFELKKNYSREPDFSFVDACEKNGKIGILCSDGSCDISNGPEDNRCAGKKRGGPSPSKYPSPVGADNI
ncbi:MAG: hypothetical protein ACU84H_12430 [Gammaproteobacteria bacterium]